MELLEAYKMVLEDAQKTHTINTTELDTLIKTRMFLEKKIYNLTIKLESEDPDLIKLGEGHYRLKLTEKERRDI